MFSVEPTLERTFFRSGAEALVARRLSLGVVELGLAEVGFLSMEGVVEGREGMGVGLTRGGSHPCSGGCPTESGGFLHGTGGGALWATQVSWYRLCSHLLDFCRFSLSLNCSGLLGQERGGAPTAWAS